MIVAPEVISFYENVTKSNSNKISITAPEAESNGNEIVTNSNTVDRGGKREGAGRKLKHGKTVVIRVPEELVNEIKKLIESHYEK